MTTGTSRRALQTVCGLALVATLCFLSGGDRPRLAATATAEATGTCTPGAGDFCASSQCGPCYEGEGDCDPGQCAAGLECVEEGATDHCRPAESCGTPGAGDFCADWRCGPCGEGEGDCDPGQCGPGLECVEEGAVDHCRPVASCTPGAADYCDPNRCGPCGDGEGDCDDGQCLPGFECMEEGAVDRCRPGPAPSTFQVRVDGTWRNLRCQNDRPMLSSSAGTWTVTDRRLTDEDAGQLLWCSEGDPERCWCGDYGERMHGINGWDVDASLLRAQGGPVYPDYETATCVYVDSTGQLATRWTDGACPDFRRLR